MTARSQPHGTVIELLWVPPAELRPNNYNPNVLDDDLYDKTVESIRKFNFVDPVTVRVVEDGRYEIIDGEHRVRAARQLNLRLIPVIILGDVDDDTAQQLTLILNELHGRPDRARLGRILQGLAERHPMEELLLAMPYAREQFLATLPTPSLPAAPPNPDATRWVERMYRLPRAAADTLDAAMVRAKEYEEVSDDWRALEVLAQTYLET